MALPQQNLNQALHIASESSRGLVADVIQEIRSGSVDVSHAMTTETNSFTTLHNQTCVRPDNDVTRISNEVRGGPIVPSSRRVLGPIPIDDVCDPSLPSEDENEVMALVGEDPETSLNSSPDGTENVHNSTTSIALREFVQGNVDQEGDWKTKDDALDRCVSDHRNGDDYTKMLVSGSCTSVEYGGSVGNIDDVLGEKMSIDRLFLPIRQAGIFKEGVRKKSGSKHVFLHPRDMLSHAYLQTAPDGVLHVLPGWDHETFIHDIAYRYQTVHIYVGPVPFLGGDLCRIRNYRCVGVFACPALEEEFRNYKHCEVDPDDKNILKNLEDMAPNEMAKKKVIGIYNGLKEREEQKKGVICGAGIPDPSNPHNVVSCKGRAVLVPRRSDAMGTERHHGLNLQLGSQSQRRCEFFIGCSGYHEEHSRLKVCHYARTTDIDNAFVPYLRRLMSGHEKVSADSGECNFVRDKNKGKRTCPRHGLRLVEIPCKLHRDGKAVHQEMISFEPLDQEHLPIESKIIYVSCRGEHLHPPPPPPEATVRKLQLIENVQKETGIVCNGRLRKEVQRRYIETKAGRNTDGLSRFEGNLVLTSSAVSKVLRRIHPPISRLANEVGELAVLAADVDMPFVRDSKMVDGGYVFFLGLDDMIMKASTEISFAGDATYRTVSEANRSVKDGRWYLYNIVVHASRERLNGAGVVVMRALMTGLSVGFYYAVWKYFFDSIARAKNLRNGEKDLDLACVMVPYIDINPAIKKRSCIVASVTMDYDVAEIHGCAVALQALCGGTIETHMRSNFIGCEVHLKRDLLRRAKDERRQKDTGMSSTELYEEYNAFAYAKTRSDAETQLKKIKTFDPTWLRWVESNKMEPLISPSMSYMSPTHRTIAFSNTNVVESHNRRGNHLVGTRLRPAAAARGLYALDKVDAEELCSNSCERIAEVGVIRYRSDSLLRPVTSSMPGARKRAKTGGPAQNTTKKRKVSRNAFGNASKKATASEMETSTKQKDVGGMRDAEKNYEEISARLQEGIASIAGQLRDGDYGSPTPEQRAARLDAIVGIMAGAHAAGNTDKVHKVRKALLDALQSIRDDLPFREALLHLCISCFGYGSSHSIRRPSEITPSSPSTSARIQCSNGRQPPTSSDIAGTES